MRARATAAFNQLDTDATRVTPPTVLPTCLRVTALSLLVWSLVTTLAQSGSASRETIFFERDVLWLFADAVVLLALSVLPRQGFRLFSRLDAVSRQRWCGWGLALLVGLGALLGAHLVFHGFAFTQDETMARFDAAIIRHGLLAAPVPVQWRPYIGALQPSFLLPIADGKAWVSSYLPVNAALRALLDGIRGVDLASSVLAGIAVLAGGSAARTLWPDRDDAPLVTMLLLATSTQFLFNAFTPFAMTAHLALDLVWLALFLRGGALRHAAAIAVAFLACGLHQLVFHPLFAAPFIAQLWLKKRWRLASVYTFAYAAICLFWILYWQLMLAHYGLHGIGRAGHGVTPFFGEAADLVRAFDLSGADLMVKNVTRFMAWENPLVLALALLGLLSIRRLETPLAALAAGLVLTTTAMFVLLPLQGFGWGYRYLHGCIGSLCLLGAGGWIAVVGRDAGNAVRSFAWTALSLASVFSLAVMVPARAVEVRAWVEPYVAAERAIQSATSDIVLIDSNGVGFGALLVRNDPFLHNRPLIMHLSDLTPAKVAHLCAAYTVSLFDAAEAERFGLVKMERVGEPKARQALDELACGAPLVTAAQAGTK